MITFKEFSEDMLTMKGFGQRQPDGTIIWFVNGQKKVAK